VVTVNTGFRLVRVAWLFLILLDTHINACFVVSQLLYFYSLCKNALPNDRFYSHFSESCYLMTGFYLYLLRREPPQPFFTAPVNLSPKYVGEFFSCVTISCSKQPNIEKKNPAEKLPFQRFCSSLRLCFSNKALYFNHSQTIVLIYCYLVPEVGDFCLRQ
jgi:hypothetical protein